MPRGVRLLTDGEAVSTVAPAYGAADATVEAAVDVEVKSGGDGLRRLVELVEEHRDVLEGAGGAPGLGHLARALLDLAAEAAEGVEGVEAEGEEGEGSEERD